MPTTYFSSYDGKEVMAKVADDGRVISDNLLPEGKTEDAILAVKDENGDITAYWDVGEFTNITLHVGKEFIGDKEYRIVKIGDQIWMAENLDFKFPGCVIGSTFSYTEPRGDYMQDNETLYGYAGRDCGLLYNWPAVKALNDAKDTLIPGWHVPTMEEWDTLANFIGGADVAGKKLKSGTLDWAPYWLDGEDTYEFTVLPGGYKASSSYYADLDACFWTISKHPSATNNAMYTQFAGRSDQMSTFGTSLYCQFSLRLVRD